MSERALLETIRRAAQVGQSVRRVDAVAKVTGEWVFGVDDACRIPLAPHGPVLHSNT